VLPALLLGQLAWDERGGIAGGRLAALSANSFTLAGITAAAAVLLATVMAYAARLARSWPVLAANRLAGLGYAVPGAVIAVGVLVPLTRLDNLLAQVIEDTFGVKTGLLLTGSVVALVYAYLVRLLAVALQTTEAGLAKVTTSMEDAARSLGAGPLGALARVHAPLLAPSLAAAALLVFVDVLKELPATFALRPFNFDTLAIEAYNLARDERLAEAAAPALVIVAVGLLPVLIVSKRYFQATRS
jgi:iron(III) transport system permease protein